MHLQQASDKANISSHQCEELKVCILFIYSYFVSLNNVIFELLALDFSRNFEYFLLYFCDMVFLTRLLTIVVLSYQNGAGTMSDMIQSNF